MKSGENILAQFAALLRSSNFRILPKKRRREKEKEISERKVKQEKENKCSVMKEKACCRHESEFFLGAFLSRFVPQRERVGERGRGQ